jgi:hypothetical protein
VILPTIRKVMACTTPRGIWNRVVLRDENPKPLMTMEPNEDTPPDGTVPKTMMEN